MQNKTIPQWITALLFPAALFYYEIVFRLATVRELFQLGSMFMLLFCVAYGIVGFLLSSIFRSDKGSRVITAVLLGVTALPYLIEYFIFRQFNIYYDLNTIFGGAADMLGGFTTELFNLLISWDGCLKIALFLLPTALYLIFGRRFLSPIRLNRKKILLVLLSLILLLAGTRGLIFLNKPLNLLLTSQYNFQSAVGQYGLLTGIGLDLKDILFGGSDSFEDTAFPAPVPDASEATTQAPTETTICETVPETTQQATEPETEPTEPPVVYYPHQMDLKLDDPDATGTIASLNAYVASLTPSMSNDYTGLFAGKNLIFITAEAFCAEVIDPELTPTLYRMATKGIRFTDFYQPSGAGTTGGEYQNVFGMLPTNGGMSFKNTADNLNYFTIGSQLNRLGYWGRAYHNNSYTYYDRHLTHVNIGYSHGFIGYGNGIEEYVAPVWPESDVEMFVGSLPDYINQQPFNVYYMTVSGHSTYYRASNASTQKNWDRVEHLEYSNLVKGYLAAQLELEDSMTYLLEQLDAKGILDDTVICIAADHFPYGLDDDAALGQLPYLSELYGHDVTTALDRDHSAMIIWSGCLEEMDPIVVDASASTLDILPTLSNLFGTEWDSRLLPGRDVLSDALPLVFNLSYDWKTDCGTYYAGYGRFEPAHEGIEVDEEYIDTISAIVRNKVRYCEGVLDYDYFGYLFGKTEE